MSNISLATALKVSALVCAQPTIASDEQLSALQQSNLIFETCTLEEIEATQFYGLGLAGGVMLESITTKRNRIERTIKAFDKRLKQSLTGTGIDTVDFSIGAPRKAATFAVLAAKINLTDGQSVSIVFHAPDDDPLKITPDDTLIAFRFLLNRSDVTHVVAPSGGTDVSLKQVTTALSNLAERNSAEFQKKQTEIKAQKDELAALQESTEQHEKEQEALSSEIEQLETQVDEKKAVINGKKAISTKLAEQNKKLEKQLAGLKAKVTEIKPKQDEQQAYASDKIKDLVRDMSLADFQIHAKKHFGMNGQTAEDTYNDTRTILEQEYKQQKEENEKKLIQDEPQNRFMHQVAEKLKTSLGSAVKFYADDKYPKVSVETAINNLRLTSGQLQEDNTVQMAIDSDYTHTSDYEAVKVVFDESLKADEKTVQDAVDKMLTLVNKYTSTVVDTSNLPAYGSKTSESKTTKEIAKETRALITKMKKEGKLPKGLKISITTDYNSISANITGIDDSIKLYSLSYLEYQRKVKTGEIDGYDYNEQFRGEAYSVDIVSIKKVVDAHIKAHHWDESDIMTDYFHSAFYYSGGLGVGYGLRDKRLASELEAYEKLKSGENIEPVESGEQNDGFTGSKYNSDLKAKDLAKAIRADIASATKDANSKLAGSRITIKAGKSTHKDKMVITIRELGDHDYASVLAAITELANAYNKKTGSSLDDSTDMHFFLEVNNESGEDVVPPAEPEQKAEFWYGLRARPIMIGTVPTGYLVALDNTQAAERLSLSADNRSIRHGAIGFADKLSQAEIDKYELVDLNTPEQSYSFTSQEIAEYVAKNIVAKHTDIKMPLTASDVANYLLGFDQTLAKYSRDHDAVIDRKENIEQYKAFKEAFDNVQKEQLESELTKFVSTESEVNESGSIGNDENKKTDGEMIDAFKLKPSDVSSRYHGSKISFTNSGTGETFKGTVKDSLNDGEILLVDVEGMTDHTYRVKLRDVTAVDELVDNGGSDEQPLDANENEDTTMPAIETLKKALKTETDADTLIGLVEAAITEVEEADQMAEYEAFLEDASNRITELLEAQ